MYDKMKFSKVVMAPGFALMLAPLALSCQIAMSAEQDPSRIATKNDPAVLSLDTEDAGAASSNALEITVKPTHVVADAPYLVQVYAGKSNVPEEQLVQTENLVGTFSLYIARDGETQQFIIPTPNLAGDRGAKIALKLIPAHPQRDLGDSALEAINARLLK
jgi:hypothetical protein